MPALETAWREARRPLEREHTTPFLWENPDRFRIGNVTWETGQDYSMSHRWRRNFLRLSNLYVSRASDVATRT